MAFKPSLPTRLEGLLGTTTILLHFLKYRGFHTTGNTASALPTIFLPSNQAVDKLRGLDHVANEGQLRLVHQSAGQPEERLLEVVVGSRREVVVLEVALAVELDVAGLHLEETHFWVEENRNTRFAIDWVAGRYCFAGFVQDCSLQSNS